METVFLIRYKLGSDTVWKVLDIFFQDAYNPPLVGKKPWPTIGQKI
jgi:hypothetical protein